MPTQRSRIELAMLRVEAERRVRAGQSRAEVSRALGVAATTLSQWALHYGWRRMDLDAMRVGEIRTEVNARISAAADAEAEQRAQEAAVEKAWADLQEGWRRRAMARQASYDEAWNFPEELAAPTPPPGLDPWEPWPAEEGAAEDGALDFGLGPVR